MKAIQKTSAENFGGWSILRTSKDLYQEVFSELYRKRDLVFYVPRAQQRWVVENAPWRRFKKMVPKVSGPDIRTDLWEWEDGWREIRYQIQVDVADVKDAISQGLLEEPGPPLLILEFEFNAFPNTTDHRMTPGSTVSKPGSLYLSPPISSPSLMSPPPRHEAGDYLSLHASLGGKKKHHTRAPVVSKISPFVVSSRALEQASVAEGHRSLVDSQWQPRDSERPPSVPPAEDNESPAILSLRRLSQAASNKVMNVPSNANEPPNPLHKAVESLFRASNAGSSIRKSSIGDSATPKFGLRRRSTAFRDGDRRRPSKTETEAAMAGLEIPATITLRKATGLFQLAPTPKEPTHDLAGESAITREESPTTCTLVGFGSRPLDEPQQVSERQDAINIRKLSTISTKEYDLLTSTPTSRVPGISSSRRQSLAETAVTVTNIFPSPAVLASPTRTASLASDPDRRFSVVQINSRKSVHQVIWREDDTSSSSATSSDPISPTGSFSNKIPETVENSPLQRSVVSSKDGTGNSSPQNSNERTPTSNVLSEREIDAPVHEMRPRPEGQMLQWSWGATAGMLDDAANSVAKTSGTLFETDPAVPQLLIPDDDGCNPPSVASAGNVRRGSFAVDTSSLASIGPGREIGSRRSISVHPLSLPRFGEDGAFNYQKTGHANLRPSRVD
ncbi:MAG: hypothetical protein Q9181_004451 [Wetmoreana brouardii]